MRFSSLGDVVLTAPVVAELKRRRPDAHIDYLVHARFSPLVARFRVPPDRIIPFPLALRAGQLPAYARDISSAGYDLLIDLHDSLRSKILRKWIRADTKKIYAKPRLKRTLLFQFGIDRFDDDYSVVGEYLAHAGLGRPDPLPEPELAVEPSALVAVTVMVIDGSVSVSNEAPAATLTTPLAST